MFDAILKATNSSFQKGMTFCRSKHVKKVMKLLAFIFEQPSYKNLSLLIAVCRDSHMPNSNQQKRCFYPLLTAIRDSLILASAIHKIFPSNL